MRYICGLGTGYFPSLSGIDKKILIREQINFLNLAEPGGSHPAGHLLFSNDEIRLAFVRALFAFVVDHNKPAITLDVVCSVSQIAGAVFHVMQNIVHESQIHIYARKFWIGEFAKHGSQVRHLAFLSFAFDYWKVSVIDFNRVDPAARRYSMTERNAEDTGSRTEVRDYLARLEPEA